MRLNSISLPSLPPLKGGEVVKVRGKDIFLLIVEPLEIWPGAYSCVPFIKNRNKPPGFETPPLKIFLHEELIEEVVDRVPLYYLEEVRGMEMHFVVGEDWRIITPVLWEIQKISNSYDEVEFISCRKASILITKEADISLLRFSRFGSASAKTLPDGSIEVVLYEGIAYFYGDAVPVEVIENGEGDIFFGPFAIWVREGEDLPEVRVIF
jgi:hypothetical protein